MQAEGAQKIIKEIIATIDKDGLNNDKLVPQLKELREFARKEEDPLVTKVLRLTYEYLLENEAFDVVPEPDTEEDEEIEVMEMTDVENLKYLIELISKSHNPYNREEIKAYRTELWDV